MVHPRNRKVIVITCYNPSERTGLYNPLEPYLPYWTSWGFQPLTIPAMSHQAAFHSALPRNLSLYFTYDTGRDRGPLRSLNRFPRPKNCQTIGSSNWNLGPEILSSSSRYFWLKLSELGCEGCFDFSIYKETIRNLQALMVCVKLNWSIYDPPSQYVDTVKLLG